uniref:Ribosomal protein S9 n=1 Tax=Panagrolaimus sp. ES5 TaxID=591445 RepID=A0AC34FC05_9BILA
MSPNSVIKPSLLRLPSQINLLRLTSSSLKQSNRNYSTPVPPSANAPVEHSSPSPPTPPDSKLKSVGSAIDSYLKNVRNYEKMMTKERGEFELGKRYLANIMGLDPMNITQQDIDAAIEYLFPSGLSDKKARPVMKPPEEILPKFNKFEFDKDGKPKDTLFFTLKPKFYGLLSEIGKKTQHLLRHHDNLLNRGSLPENTEPLSLEGTVWKNQADISRILGDKLSDEMYAQLIIALDYLQSLPLASLEKDFIETFRVPVMSSRRQDLLFGPQIPEVQIDAEHNRRFATITTKAKSVQVEVTVKDNGSGKYTVDGHHYDVFRSLMARENLIAPLIVTEMFGRVDIEAKVLNDQYGLSIVPRAVRHGVSLGIAALFPDTKEKLRDMDMLTMEPRVKERSKVNQPGARAKWIWKRR